MQEKELLQSIAEMFDEKLEAALTPLKAELAEVKKNQEEFRKELEGFRKELADFRRELSDVKKAQADFRTELAGIKQDIANIKQVLFDVRHKQDVLEAKLTALQLHVENGTDRNIQLLAENHINLIDRLNQAVPAADKSIAYEVKVTYLIDEVAKLKDQVIGIIDKTA